MHFKTFKFPAKIRVSTIRKIIPQGPSDSWLQDLEFGPRMDIFGPIEAEICQLEVLSMFQLWK